jgi:hypothetical protein
MLTLGLMEGFFAATLGALLLAGAANENVPLHRVFGPLVMVTVGFAAYGIHASGAMGSGGEVLGLGFFAFVAFFAPLGFMRACWKAVRRMNEAPARPAAQAGTTAAAPVAVVTPPAASQEPRKVA